MNVGASSVTDYGLFFAWGETTGYSSDSHYYRYDNRTFDPTNYKYYTGDSYVTSIYDYEGVLNATNDAARVNWGGTWRMPTKAECEELINTANDSENYEWAWQTDYLGSGYKGWLVTSKKTGTAGNSIFLPAAGYRTGNELPRGGLYGYFWSSSIVPKEDAKEAWYMAQNSSTLKFVFYDNRCLGYSVRPVFPK